MSRTNKSHLSVASSLIMDKPAMTKQAIRNEQNKQQFIRNNNDTNVVANVLQQQVEFQDRIENTKEDAMKIENELLNEIRQWVETEDFNNDVNNMFKSQFLSDVFKQHQCTITANINQNLNCFKNNIIKVAKERLTARSNSNWNNLSGISQQEKQCYSNLEYVFCQNGLGNTIGLNHLLCLKNNKEVFQVFKNCSILATILPVLDKISSDIKVSSLEQIKQQATEKLDGIKMKYKLIFKKQGYNETFPEINVGLFCFAFGMNCSHFDKNTKGASWLEDQIKKIAKGHLKCDITQFENWQTITNKVDVLSRYYQYKTTQPHIWINTETALLEEICKGLFDYLNKQIEQNQCLRADKENDIIDEKAEEELKSNEEENNVDANNENNDNINNNDTNNLHFENNKEDEEKDIDNNEKNREIKEDQQSNSSLKNDGNINEDRQENSNSNDNDVDKNELEAFTIPVNENEPEVINPNNNAENNNINNNVDVAANNKTEQKNENNNNVVKQHQNENIENNNDNEQNNINQNNSVPNIEGRVINQDNNVREENQQQQIQAQQQAPKRKWYYYLNPFNWFKSCCGEPQVIENERPRRTTHHTTNIINNGLE